MDGSGQDEAQDKAQDKAQGETMREGPLPDQGEPSKPPRKPTMGRRCLKGAMWTATALVGVPLLAAGGLMAAMMVGPVNISPLLRLALPVKIVGGGKGQPARGRLDIGHASLRWTGLRDGFGSPVLLELRDVTILDATGKVADRVDAGAIALDAFPLFHGSLSVTDFRVTGAHIALRRDAQGDVDLDLPGASSGGKGAFPDIDVRHLRRLTLAGTHVVLTDDHDHRTWTVDPLNAALTPVVVKHRHGLVGSVTVGAASEDAGAPVTAHLVAQGAVTPEGTLCWHIALDPLTPSGFASFAPGLAAVRVPVGLAGDITMTSAGRAWYMLPSDALVNVTLGTGEIDAAGSTLYPAEGDAALHMTFGKQTAAGWPAHLDLQALSVQLRAPPAPADSVTAPPPETVVPASVPVAQKGAAKKNKAKKTSSSKSRAKDTVREAPPPKVVEPLPPPLLTANGAIDWGNIENAGLMNGGVNLAMTPVPFTELGKYWPALAAKGARRWVGRNITAGTVRNTQVHLKIGPDDTGGSSTVTGISGGLDGEGMDIHWLRPIAPLHDVDAHLDATSLSTLTLSFKNGWQPTTRTVKSVGMTGSGRLTALPGGMIISGLDQKDQTGTIMVGLAGDLRDHVALLSEPRLHVLSRHPLPFTNPRGYAVVRFTLTLPLVAKVSTDDMTLDGHAHMTHVSLEHVAMGRGVSDGTLDTDVTMHGMKLVGKGAFSHIPADVRGEILFDQASKGQVIDHIVTNLHLTPDNLVAAGIPVADYMTGRGEMKADYAAIKEADDRLALDLDLLNASVHIPLWNKVPGRAATVHADLLLDGSNIVAATDIRAKGPDLNITGEAHLPTGQSPELVIPAFQIGRSTGSALLTMPTRPAKPVSVKVRAKTLDLSPLVEGAPDRPAPPAKGATLHVPEAASGRIQGPPGRPWLIDVTADQLYYRHDRTLGGVKAFIDHNGVRVDRMKVSITEPTAAQAEILPLGDSRRMTVNVPDFGALLSRLAVTDMVVGGHAQFEGRFDDTKATAPFRGHLKLSPFTIQHAPGALLVARSLSIYGWLNSKDTSRFEVTRFEMPVTFADGVMHIHDGRAGNGALGATLEGPVNLDKGTLDLSGTIVPAFAINAIPGEIPALGKLLSPEKGGGLLAVKFSLDGKIDKPDFSVSPLTILLPGVLRNLF
ncbi:AsmA-like protein [Acetobacter aceti NBRC 14818]|nr:AsmA-like protein [Acetobacter aceti NBRC 14818]